MKESEILREVGRRFEENLEPLGICYAVKYWYATNGHFDLSNMFYTTQLHKHILTSYWSSFDYLEEDRPARALACYWMAHELEEEGR